MKYDIIIIGITKGIKGMEEKGISQYLHDLTDDELVNILEEIIGYENGNNVSFDNVNTIHAYITRFIGKDYGLDFTVPLIKTEVIERYFYKNKAKDSENNDSYSFSCVCPTCKIKMQRGVYEYTTHCTNCGQKIHVIPFTEEEILEGKIERKTNIY